MIAASCGSVRTFQMETSRCNDTILLCQTQSSQVSLCQTCLQLASPSCQEAEVHLPHQRLALHPSKTPMPGAFYSFIRSPHWQRCRNFPESPLRLSRLYRGQRCFDRLQLADLLPQQQRCIRSQETSRVKLGRNSSTSSSPAAALFLPFNVLVAICAVSVSVRRIPALLPVTCGKLFATFHALPTHCPLSLAPQTCISSSRQALSTFFRTSIKVVQSSETRALAYRR